MQYSSRGHVRPISKHVVGDEELEIDFPTHFKHAEYGYHEQVIPVRVITFNLNRAIGDPHHYSEMIHIIRSAAQHDYINIHLATPGGNMTTGVQIINAIRDSRATVTTILDSEACSLGTFIFLAGHRHEVQDDAIMMFHDVSYGSYGKSHEHASRVELLRKWYGKLCHRICAGFLSPEEIDKVLRGDDLWMDADEVRDRLDKMYEYQEQQEAADEDAVDGDGEDGEDSQGVEIIPSSEDIANAVISDIKPAPVRRGRRPPTQPAE